MIAAMINVLLRNGFSGSMRGLRIEVFEKMLTGSPICPTTIFCLFAYNSLPARFFFAHLTDREPGTG